MEITTVCQRAKGRNMLEGSLVDRIKTEEIRRRRVYEKSGLRPVEKG